VVVVPHLLVEQPRTQTHQTQQLPALSRSVERWVATSQKKARVLGQTPIHLVEKGFSTKGKTQRV